MNVKRRRRRVFHALDRALENGYDFTKVHEKTPADVAADLATYDADLENASPAALAAAMVAWRARTAIAAVVALAKRQLRAHVASGAVPRAVASFAALHDYVDANEYGADAVALTSMDDVLTIVNPAQAALDRWIRRGGLRRARVE
jgi:hypothetical protein